MYTEFFGLSDKPFELLPNPRFLYLSKCHRKALSYLQYGIEERAGFTLLTGEVGSGKTTLIRDIINKISAEMTLAMVFNTRVDGRQLISMINDDFGLEVEGKDKVELLKDLNDFLLYECGQQRRPIIIVDEAQNLSEGTLEELRLLSNLESDELKMVQIVLVGQPELKSIIAQPSLRQLRQRISVSCHLSPLNQTETQEYIFHRLKTVGGAGKIQFTEGVFEAIFHHSSGVPRLINLLCDFVLLSAFVEESYEINLQMVQDAISELSFEQHAVQEDQSSPRFAADSHDLRLTQIENRYEQLNRGREEREAILDRLKSQGSILEYLINQQQGQFGRIDDRLKTLSAQIDRLRQAILVKDKGFDGIQESLNPEVAKIDKI